MSNLLRKYTGFKKVIKSGLRNFLRFSRSIWLHVANFRCGARSKGCLDHGAKSLLIHPYNPYNMSKTCEIKLPEPPSGYNLHLYGYD